jgi:hypothetical protein
MMAERITKKGKIEDLLLAGKAPAALCAGYLNEFVRDRFRLEPYCCGITAQIKRARGPLRSNEREASCRV